jgi:hypothetical protein
MNHLKQLLTLLVLLLLMGCGGSGHDSGLPLTVSDPDSGQPGSQLEHAANLVLAAQALESGEWSLMLSSREASDIYQIAGSLLFDQTKYEIVSVEAGGGLGGPDEAYFVNSYESAGELDFAYTSRYFGSIHSGNINLLRLKIRPVDSFSLTDFSLPTTPDKLLVRDSHKRALETSFRRSGS